MLTIGSAGKSFWGLRIGWIRASARPSPRLFRPAIRWIGYAAAGATGLQLATGKCRHTAAAAADMLKARRDMCETLMAEYFPAGGFRHRKVGSFGWNFLTCWPPCSLRVRKADPYRHRYAVWAGRAFDRYLRLPFTLPDEALRRAFSTLQPLWQSLAEQKENTRLRK